MQTLRQDIRFGLRMLLKNPVFALAAVVTTAFGIGANVTIFSVVNAVTWRSLPFDDPDRLVMVWSRNLPRNQPRFGVSSPDFKDWSEQGRVFSSLAAFNPTNGNVTGRGGAERIRIVAASGGYFETLGVKPLLGRTFGTEEAKPGRDDVAVLSEGFWKRRFGGDPSVIGQTLTLDGRARVILGVLPAEMTVLDDQARVWTPLALENDPSGRGARWLTVIARLKPDVPRERALADLNAVAERLSREHPDTNTNWEIFLEPLHEAVVGNIRSSLFMVWGAVAVVLLMASVNVAGLLSGRAAERNREIAVRLALGAGRGRIVRQLLTESLLLSVFGGLVGLVFAWWGVRALSSLDSALLPRAGEIEIDRVVLGFTTAVSVLTGLLFGLFPARGGARTDLREALAESGRSGPSGRRTHNLLIVAETALAVVVLIGAGLLVRSFVRLTNVETGFNPKNVTTARVAPAWKTKLDGKDEEVLFRELTAERVTAEAFHRRLAERIAGLPGVESVSAVNRLPLTGNWWQSELTVEGRPPLPPDEKLSCNARVVLPDYFRTMNVPLVEGRDVSASDHADAPKVVVLNREAVHRFFPNENPLGRRIAFENADDPHVAWYTVVGIVGNERHNRLELEPTPMVYLPFGQARFGHFGDWGMAFVVRSGSSPEPLISAIRGVVAELDPNLPVSDIRTMEEVMARSVAQRRFLMSVLSFFACVTLILATVGIYGVVSYSVARRTREIGVRTALGAQQGDILKMIVGRGMGLAMIGILLGCAVSFGLTRLAASFLYGITTTDAVTFSATAATALAAAFAACWIPARRAVKIDPSSALRGE